MFIKIAICPVCDSEDFSNYMICKDHSISQEDFAIVKCNVCSFLFVNPRPEDSHLNSYYQSDEYISHSNKSTGLINFVYKIARFFTLRKKVKLINRLSTKGTLLDIGCGTGHFLKAAQKNGWQTVGLEPEDEARKIAQKQVGININHTLDEIKSKFDIITLWHVLEHVPELNKYLQSVKQLLNKTGTLVVAVPNQEAWDAKAYGGYWAAWDVPRHLYHFNQKTMKKVMKKHGFKIKETLPMKLDAYYVSMLSEKYKNKGKTKYIKSFINGWKSNSYARKNNDNYSSLIYILSHKK